MIEDLPLVSVVIAAYNAEAHIAEAIESVLGQSHPRMECVVVDDGSEDRTADVVGNYGSAVSLVRQQNKGVAAARNAGAARVTGSALAFLDADDAWLPDKVSLQLPVLGREKVGLVYGPYWMADEGLAPLQMMEAPRSEIALRNTLLLEEPSINIAQTALFEAGAFRAVGGYDETLSTSADLDLGLRVGFRFGVGSVDEPLALYRRHPQQMSRDVWRQEVDMLRVFQKAFLSGSLPPTLMKDKRRAYSNLRWTLAGGYLEQGNKRRAAANLFWSSVFDPARFAGRVRERVSRVRG